MSNPSVLVLENNINTIIPYTLEDFTKEIENKKIK
jgi:hypothetical protein